MAGRGALLVNVVEPAYGPETALSDGDSRMKWKSDQGCPLFRPDQASGKDGEQGRVNRDYIGGAAIGKLG